MAKQEGEPPFGYEEPLYRRLIAAWVAPDDSVDPAAIEIPACSVDRGLYSTAQQTLDRGNDEDVAVAAARFGELPTTFEASPPAKPYELVVIACPEAGNPAHSHLETRQVGALAPRKPGPALKQQIRDEIAATMRVVLRK